MIEIILGLQMIIKLLLSGMNILNQKINTNWLMHLKQKKNQLGIYFKKLSSSGVKVTT